MPVVFLSLIIVVTVWRMMLSATSLQVVFIPAHRIANLDDRDTAATTEILREEMRKGSQSIISYDSSNGSLEKMREDAFM